MVRLDCIQFILETYGTVDQVARESSPEQTINKVFRTSRDFWYPAVQAIRVRRIPVNDRGKERLRDLALQTWLGFGKQLGFHERVEERRIKKLAELGETTGIGPLPSMPGAKSCRWKECLCSWDEKPPHRMRVCKGCWRVCYCSTRCQIR